MAACSVPRCSNNSRKGWRLFRFPADPERRRLWTAQMKRENWEPRKSSCVCSAHFVESSFEQHRADGWKKLKPNAVPTVLLSRASRQRKPAKKRTELAASSVASRGGALHTHEDAAVTHDPSPLASKETNLVLLPRSIEGAPVQDYNSRTLIPSNSPEDGDHSEDSSSSLILAFSSTKVFPEQDFHSQCSLNYLPKDENYSEHLSPAPQCNGARDLQSDTCLCAELHKQLADLAEKFNLLHNSHTKANATIQGLAKKVRKLENDARNMKKRLEFRGEDQAKSVSQGVAKRTPGRCKQSGNTFRSNSHVERQVEKRGGSLGTPSSSREVSRGLAMYELD